MRDAREMKDVRETYNPTSEEIDQVLEETGVWYTGRFPAHNSLSVQLGLIDKAVDGSIILSHAFMDFMVEYMEKKGLVEKDEAGKLSNEEYIVAIFEFISYLFGKDGISRSQYKQITKETYPLFKFNSTINAKRARGEL